jgi:hypothetical protein
MIFLVYYGNEDENQSPAVVVLGVLVVTVLAI